MSRIKRVLRAPVVLASHLPHPAQQGNSNNCGSGHGDPNPNDTNPDDRHHHSRHWSIGDFFSKRKLSQPPSEPRTNTTRKDSFREFFFVHIALPEYAGGQSRGTGGKASSSQCPKGNNTAPAQGSQLPYNKRGNGQSNDGRRNKKQKGNGEDSEQQEPGKGGENPRVLCPFYLRDPSKYARCLNYTLRSTADVRQHVKRKHKKPFHCPMCKRIFGGGHEDAGSRKELNEHIRQKTCELSDNEPGLTEGQVEQLSSPERQKGNTVENWNSIWDILFPGVRHPASPYVTGSELEAKIRGLVDAFLESARGLPAEKFRDWQDCCTHLVDYVSIFEGTPTLSNPAPEMPIPVQVSRHETPFPPLHDSVPKPIPPARQAASPNSEQLDPESGRQQLENMFPEPLPHENTQQSHFPNNQDSTQQSDNLDDSLPQQEYLAEMDHILPQLGVYGDFFLADLDFISDEEQAFQMAMDPTAQNEGGS